MNVHCGGYISENVEKNNMLNVFREAFFFGLQAPNCTGANHRYEKKQGHSI
jgi:hypothetical protein